MIVQLDVKAFFEMFKNGYRNLCARESEINDLNVFPVPDGDTGTNMAKTLGGGLNTQETSDMKEFMNAFSRNVLLSARGNSGVILSQYICGIAKGVNTESVITPKDFVYMLQSGVEKAYQSVIKPTEGTILTVIRESAEAALEKAELWTDFETLFSELISEMKSSLAKTPELLPVLKEANVVDSGGFGIVTIFEGMLLSLQGVTIEEGYVAPAKNTAVTTGFGPDSELEYGYCTEFILQLMHAKCNIDSFSVKDMITYLESIGDSIVAVKDNDIVKVHVHTFTPEKALGYARNFGEFINVKIENMSLQHSEVIENKQKKKEKKKYAVVAVASGDGFKNYFSEIGADVTVDGGQTQNPSAEDFLTAFEEICAEYIIVLPNNSNIISTACLAADMYKEAEVRVLNTKSMVEGYSALSMMNTWVDNVDEFVEEMVNGAENVTSGAVAKAVHDADMNGVHVDKDACIGVSGGVLSCAADTPVNAALDLLKSLSDIESKEVLTVFYGEDSTEEDAKELVSAVKKIFPKMECGILYGGQKVYNFYLAVE